MFSLLQVNPWAKPLGLQCRRPPVLCCVISPLTTCNPAMKPRILRKYWYIFLSNESTLKGDFHWTIDSIQVKEDHLEYININSVCTRWSPNCNHLSLIIYVALIRIVIKIYIALDPNVSMYANIYSLFDLASHRELALCTIYYLHKQLE